MGSAIPGQFVLGSMRKVSEKPRRNKLVISVPPWFLLQLPSTRLILVSVLSK